MIRLLTAFQSSKQSYGMAQFFTELLQKVRDFRVPVESSVRLTFSRKVKREISPEDDVAEEVYRFCSYLACDSLF